MRIAQENVWISNWYILLNYQQVSKDQPTPKNLEKTFCQNYSSHTSVVCHQRECHVVSCQLEELLSLHV